MDPIGYRITNKFYQLYHCFFFPDKTNSLTQVNESVNIFFSLSETLKQNKNKNNQL